MGKLVLMGAGEIRRRLGVSLILVGAVAGRWWQDDDKSPQHDAGLSSWAAVDSNRNSSAAAGIQPSKTRRKVGYSMGWFIGEPEPTAIGGCPRPMVGTWSNLRSRRPVSGRNRPDRADWR